MSQVQKSNDLPNGVSSDHETQTKHVELLPDFHAADILQKLGWSVSGEETPDIVILVLGRTNNSDDTVEAQLSQLFDRGLARALAKKRAFIIDRTADDRVVTDLSSALHDRVVTRPTFLLRIVNSHENPASTQVDEDQLLDTTRFVTVKGKNWTTRLI